MLSSRRKSKRNLSVKSLSDTTVNVTSRNSPKRIWSRPSSSARDFNAQTKTDIDKRFSKIKQTSGSKPEREDDGSIVYVWEYGEYTFDIPYHVSGEGSKDVLFLPTINIASSWKELAGLTRFFGPSFRTFTPDWPGFGNSTRFDCIYSPPMFLQFIRDFVNDVILTSTISVVACGHAAGYVLNLAKTYPHMWDRICIISPTYRSPVKTLGWHSVSSSLVKSAVRSSLLGDYLYQKAIQPSFLRKQYETNIFRDKTLVTDDFIREKCNLANKQNGKAGPVSFFTGKLDIVKSREEMIGLLRCIESQITIAIGEGSPSSSLIEMQEMAKVPGLDIIRLDGSLGVAEESPRDVAEVLMQYFVKL